MAKAIGDMPIIFGDPRQPKALPLSHPKAGWDDFTTETRILPKGHVRRRGCLALPCDILFERDQAVKLSDGTTIYVDIYRPTTPAAKAPAILAWSPYGKAGGKGNQTLDDFPFRLGVPVRELSEFQKWEGPDPAYWVAHGYAVINADPRGAGKSEGDIYTMGSKEAKDAADLIDWLGKRDWCNGKVGMSGNSWLAVIQWSVAALKPKHLAAIAPWEGFSDLFREGPLLGGVESKPTLNFVLQILSVNGGENSWENVVATGLQHKVHGAYHQDKSPAIEDIEIPAYVVASWSNTIHVYGTFRSYCRLRGLKWLRVHDSVEWPDYYDHENRTDLHRFFDRYLKNIDNGWESTPKVRTCIIDTAKSLPRTSETMTSSEFPSHESRPLTLFFGADQALSPTYPQPYTSTYEVLSGELVFEYRFDRDVILYGPLEIQLAVSLAGNSDSDVFVYVEKVLSDGVTIGQQLVVPFEKGWQTSVLQTVHWSGIARQYTNVIHYRGPKGCIRVSRRAVDPSTEQEPFPVQEMKAEPQYAQNEDVIRIKPNMLPIGMRFWRGERIRLRVSGENEIMLPPVDQATVELNDLVNINDKGSVTVHCGLKDPAQRSYVKLPVYHASS